MRFALPILFLTLGLSACMTPLQKAVRDTAPGFDAMAPVRAESQLGRRWSGKEVEVNACFAGPLQESQPEASWQLIQASYDGSSDGSLTADFSSLLKADGSAASKQKVTVELTDIRLRALPSLWFLPASSCADDEAFNAQSKGHGQSYDVITQELWADKLSLTEDSSGSAKLKLDVSASSSTAEVSGNTANTAKKTWTGVGLHFARLIQQVKVTSRKNECTLTPGSNVPCDLQDCGLRLTGLDPDGTWAGDFTCLGGGTEPTRVTGKLGNWVAITPTKPGEFGEGVSFGVRGLPGASVGSVAVELRRFVALSQ